MSLRGDFNRSSVSTSKVNYGDIEAALIAIRRNYRCDGQSAAWDSNTARAFSLKTNDGLKIRRSFVRLVAWSVSLSNVVKPAADEGRRLLTWEFLIPSRTTADSETPRVILTTSIAKVLIGYVG